MSTWKTQLHEFNLRLTIGKMRKIKDDAGVDLLAMGEGAEKAQQQLLDMLIFVSVMGAVCEDQVAKAGLDKDSFVQLFDDTPTAYQEAMEAFGKAVEDFFRERGRSDLAMLHKKGREIATTIVTATAAKIQTVDTKIVAETIAAVDLNGEIARTLDPSKMAGKAFLKPPVPSVAGTPADSASANSTT